MISAVMINAAQATPMPSTDQPIHHASASSSTRMPPPPLPGNLQPTVYAGYNRATSPHPMSMNHTAQDATCMTNILVTADRGRSINAGAVEPTNVRAPQATNTPHAPQDKYIAHPPTTSIAVAAMIAQCSLARGK